MNKISNLLQEDFFRPDYYFVLVFKNILIVTFTLFLLSSCSSSFDCFNESNYIVKSKADLVKKASERETYISETLSNYSLQGVAVDFNNPIVYFDENCNGNQNLEQLEPFIGLLLKNRSTKVVITGNATKNEILRNRNLSLERAQFVKKILLLNDITEDRITIVDAKSNQPATYEENPDQKENRRVELYFTK